MSDAELVLQARREPIRPALRALYERHEPEVYRFLLRLVGDASLAEDVLQETFLLVHQHLHRYDADRPFRPWLFRIARNAGLNALRARRKVEPSLEDVEPEPGGSTPEERGPVGDVTRREAADETREALERLPDEVRALLIQRHALGMKLAELAESWSVTERTIRNRLDDACAQLTQALLVARQGGRA